MDELFDRVDPLRAWAASLVGLVAVVAAAAAVAPGRVYDEFIWKYFWGPVVADAHAASCAVREGGSWELLYQGCATASGVVAEPGYTTISTASYAVLLLFGLVGVYLALDRLELSEDFSLFYALFPFVLFGGAFRVLEDANATLLVETGSAPISFPASALLISPFIYVTVFVLALLSLLVSMTAANRGLIERYEHGVAAIGTVAVVGSVGYLGWLAMTSEYLAFNPGVAIVTLVGATVVTALVWVAVERFAPGINRGTGYMGALIVWGHTVDGIANVLSLDWNHVFGLPSYSPKHVANATIRNVTGSIQPAWLTDMIGQTWPFIPVKVGAALFVVWVFEDEVMDESPTYSLLLLIAVLAVGLGPGTRDFLRATFGI